MGFLEAQPAYARHNVPLFPVHITADGSKRPRIRNYQRVGLSGSVALTRQFADEPAFGFLCGKRSNVTVLDVDTTDEGALSDGLARHGRTPLVIRTARRRFQAWYRWNGERRRIRPSPDRPIDILGDGFVVAPDSRAAHGQYEIIQGSLDDLDCLPPLANLDEVLAGEAWGMTAGSGRNNHLFRSLGHEAHHCDDFDALLDRARTLNDDFAEPLEDEEVIRCARSIWRMTIENRNRFGRYGAWLPLEDVDQLACDPFLATLLLWLKAHHGPTNTFWVANGLQQKLGWPRRQLKLARQRAIDSGWIKQLAPARRGSAAQYTWGPAALKGSVQGGSKKITTVYVENSLPDLAPHSVEVRRGDSA
jgi:bifunctional DNA primase/polymerase-like protein/primase-like protein